MDMMAIIMTYMAYAGIVAHIYVIYKKVISPVYQWFSR